MNILIVWRNIPINWNVSTNKILSILQYLHNKGNEVTLVVFKSKPIDEDQITYINKYSNLYLIDPPSSSKLHTYVSHFRDLSFFPFSKDMRKIIEKVIIDKNIDIIYVDQSMVNHVLKLDSKVPIVLDVIDPLAYSSFQYFKKDKSMIQKLRYLIIYIICRYFDLPRYKNLDAFIFVSSIHKKLLSPYIPEYKMQFCIPQGIDIEWFAPQNSKTKSNCLIFTGTMNYRPNIQACVFFCEKIFPLIKKEISDATFYIAGANPTEEVLKLNSEDIVVTGFVKDMRMYLERSSVVVVPIVTDDGGFKVKVLEAMAMGKAIVSTSLGSKGLNVIDGENIIIKDDPEEFAGAVIDLLKNQDLKLEIEKKTRNLVIDQYSYEIMDSLLLTAFKKISQNYHD